jgi:hypothetical protein
MAVNVTVTKESAAVFVDVALGEHLIYKLTVKGAEPIFTLVDSETEELLMSQDDQPSATTPNVVFERRWPLDDDQIQDVTSHVMGLQFLGAISYRYLVQRKRLSAATETIIDITYTATEAEDSHFQNLQVSTV